MHRLLSLAIVLFLSTPTLASDWKLVFSDEFNKDGLPDPAKWDYETGFIRNNESQFYTKARAENARVENGHLIIEARKEQWKNPDYVAPAANAQNQPNQPVQNPRRGGFRRTKEFADYTSASLNTFGKHAWTYGRFEVRAKVPTGRGTWPAIWTLGTNRSQAGWPACGEIDIMEFVGYEPGVIHANVHTRKYNHTRGTGRGDKTKVPDASETFHVYAVEWHPDRMDFFVDDRRYFTCKNDGTGADAWPFDQPQYLILNLAIGGDWGGRKGIDESAFPQRFEIDYVRIYQNPAATPQK